ncbi:MAG: hypothetical protein H6752_08275 [Candidatus Omnitrophica bacterium]|nr:hypothetical protein [Candidatus Omnitrophota bacterium]
MKAWKPIVSISVLGLLGFAIFLLGKEQRPTPALRFSLTVIGDPNVMDLTPTDLNDFGAVVGWGLNQTNSFLMKGFHWTKGDGLTMIEKEGWSTTLSVINNQGLIARDTFDPEAIPKETLFIGSATMGWSNLQHEDLDLFEMGIQEHTLTKDGYLIAMGSKLDIQRKFLSYTNLIFSLEEAPIEIRGGTQTVGKPSVFQGPSILFLQTNENGYAATFDTHNVYLFNMEEVLQKLVSVVDEGRKELSGSNLVRDYPTLFQSHPFPENEVWNVCLDDMNRVWIWIEGAARNTVSRWSGRDKLEAIDFQDFADVEKINSQGTAIGTRSRKPPLYDYYSSHDIPFISERLPGIETDALIWIEGIPYLAESLVEHSGTFDILTLTDLNAHNQIIGSGEIDGKACGFLLEPTNEGKNERLR